MMLLDAAGELDGAGGVAEQDPHTVGGPDGVVAGSGAICQLAHDVDRTLVGELDRDLLVFGEVLDDRFQRLVFRPGEDPKRRVVTVGIATAAGKHADHEHAGQDNRD
jgi:hypothetical protein